MWIIFVVAFIASVSQATVVPRERFIPEEQLNPRLTGAEWTEILAKQVFTPEVIEDFREGTAPQDDLAGVVVADVTDESKIIGGSPAVLGQFPWSVAITSDSKAFCGGSLISANYVLTAGHCVATYTSFHVIVGSIHRTGDTGSVAQTSRSHVLHEHWYTNRTDIGLIKLASPLTFTTHIRPVRLPTKSDVTNLYVGSVARVAGWGITTVGSGVSNILNWISLDVVANAVCTEHFGSNNIKPTIICTSSGGPGKNICSGDSGSPLVILGSDGFWKQVGITVFGGPTCTTGHLAGYTRVTSFLTWIQTHTGIVIKP